MLLILRKALSDLWTPAIKKRSKQGFGAPVGKWLNEKSIRELKDNYLNNQKRKIFEILPSENVKILSVKNNYKTWALLVLSIWLEKHNFDV